MPGKKKHAERRTAIKLANKSTILEQPKDQDKYFVPCVQ